MTQPNASVGGAGRGNGGGGGAGKGTGGGGSVHRPPDDVEEVYFDGTPSLKGEAGTLVLLGLIDLVLIAGAVVGGLALGGLGLLITVPAAAIVSLLLFAYPVLRLRSRRYKITNYRIDYEQGLLSKSIDTLELWHVEDIAFRQSLSDRILGVGTIIVLSHDDTMPQLEMKGLPDPRRLFDLLKQRVISVKRQRGVLKIDSGS